MHCPFNTIQLHIVKFYILQQLQNIKQKKSYVVGYVGQRQYYF